MLLSAVYELCTVKAIAPDEARYTPAEWRVYSEGYYFGVARSLTVMDLAVNRWAMYRRTRTLETRARKRG